MQRAARVSLLAALTVVLTACASSPNEADSTSADRTSSSPHSEAELASGAAPPTTASAAAPVVLDTQTVAWFDTLCTGLTRSLQNLGTSDAGLADPSLSQSEIVAGVQAAGAELAATTSPLTALPAPTVKGGPEFATGFTTGLSAAAVSFPQIAATFAAVQPSDAAGLAAGKAALQNDLLTALAPPLQSVSRLPHDVRATIKVITSCQAFVG